MAVYWASRKNPVTSSSRDSHVIKISKSYSERTIAVRPYYSHRGVNPEATVGFAYDRDCRVDYHDDDTDSKVTHFATPRYTKPKEIGPIPTIRFQDIDLNCVIG